MKKKSFASITVQEIIDEANIGRSTFYSHFETKDALLEELCKDIFDHIAMTEKAEISVCESFVYGHLLRDALIHILWHVQDSKWDLKIFVLDDSNNVFLSYYRSELENLFNSHLDEIEIKAPKEFLLHQLAASFAEATVWWVKNGQKCTKEELADYYLNTIRLNQ